MRRWLMFGRRGGGAAARRLALALAGACLLAGCGIFGVSEEELLYRDGSSEPMQVPEGVDLPDFVDLMPIPEVDDYRGLGDAELEIGPPEALSTRFDVDQIVIRKLGSQQWVFIDMPPAIIWPEVLGYFAAQNLPLAAQEPDQGIVETEWLQAALVEQFSAAADDDAAADLDDDAATGLGDGAAAGPDDGAAAGPDDGAAAGLGDDTAGSLGGDAAAGLGDDAAAGPDDGAAGSLGGDAAAGLDDDAAASRHKFRALLEPGIRNGSSELYVSHRQRAAEASGPDGLDWAADSDDLEMEGALLRAIAFHLGEATAQGGGPAVSMMAAGMTDEGKARLETGPDGLALLYRLDFDRAWATVGAALENANVEVEDLDRSAGIYYVEYSSEGGPGFFRRLFSGDDDDEDEEDEDRQRFQVQLEAFADEVEVTVFLDGEAQQQDEDEAKRNLLLSERLLKLIREHST